MKEVIDDDLDNRLFFLLYNVLCEPGALDSNIPILPTLLCHPLPRNYFIRNHIRSIVLNEVHIHERS